MKATLNINMDTAAFDDNAPLELAGALEMLARRIKDEWDGKSSNVCYIRDANGNKVGQLYITH